MSVPFVNVRPKSIKLKVLPHYPANLEGRTGIDVVKENGNYFVDIDYGDFMPVPGSYTPDPNKVALVWNSATGIYELQPVTSLAGGIPEAPNDGQQYARQSLGWSVVAAGSTVLPSNTNPIMDGVAAPGASALYSRGDHIHPSDTSRYAASNPSGYQTAAQVTAALPVPATATPIVESGAGTVGTSVKYAREDHVHPAGGGGGGASVTVSDTPPASPTANSLWWESDTGALYIYYNDGNSSQWVLIRSGTTTPGRWPASKAWW